MSKFGHSLTTHHSPEVGVGELLYVKNLEQQGWVTLHHKRLVLMPGPFLIQEEFEKRLSFICSGDPVVAKYMPIQFSVQEEVEILLRIIPMFDRVFLLRRQNFTDHRLSFCLSLQLDSWVPNKTQKDIINKTMNSPILLNPELFTAFDNMLGNFNSIITTVEKKLSKDLQTIFFDDIIKCDNDSKFCTFLTLPYVPFKFISNMQEFGSDKSQMLKLS